MYCKSANCLLSIAILLLFLAFTSCHNRQTIDLIVHNGEVYTVDSAFRVAEAFAVKDGKIIAIGRNDDILKSYKSDSIVDAHGMAVYPGFIDAHAHFVSYG